MGSVCRSLLNARGARVQRGPNSPITCWGLLGAGNIGNDASFETFAHWLRSNDPAVRLAIVSTAPVAAREKFGVPTRGVMTSSGPRTAAGLVRRAFSRMADLSSAFLVIPRSADSVVVVGMGVLEDSIKVSPLGLPLLLALMASGCRRAGSNFILLDVGAEFARDPWTRRLFAHCLRTATHVSVRDDLSYRVARTAAPERPIPVAPDLVFAHPVVVTQRPTPRRIVVGVISAEHSLGARGSQYEEKMIHLIQGLQRRGLEVVLVGGDATDGPAAHSIADRAALLDPESRRPRVSIVDDYAELVAIIGTAEVVVASRFHNLVAAIRAGRPVLSIGYAPKCEQLLDTVGLSSYSFDLENFDVTSVDLAVGEMLDRSEELSRLVRGRSRCFAGKVEDLMAQLAEVLNVAVPRRAEGRRGHPV